MFSNGAGAAAFRNAYVGIDNDGCRFDVLSIHRATDTRQEVWDRDLIGRVLREDVGLGQHSHVEVATPTDAMPSSMILPAMVECCPGRRRGRGRRHSRGMTRQRP